MKTKMTKVQVLGFRNRWKAVKGAEKTELRRTPMSKKLQQLAALMMSVRQMGWEESLASEEVEVRERWNKLRQVIGV